MLLTTRCKERIFVYVQYNVKGYTIMESGSCSSSSNDDTAFICIYCGKVFPNMDTLQLHQKQHNLLSEVQGIVDSSDCERKTGSSVEYVENFSDDPTLQMCNWTTHKKVQLTNTKMSNDAGVKKKVKKEVTKNHICSECNQSFEKRSYLILHMRSHTGERPYKCSVCSKSFRLIGHIVTHMTTHSTERPFECSMCDKKFARGDYMKKHMKTHTGEKPFVCSVCERAFTLKGNLERHMVSHTKEKRYVCKVCGEKFVWEKTMLRHVEKSHSQVSNGDPS